MKVKTIEIKNKILNTVEDMIVALMETPKGYTLNPLGQNCVMAVDNVAQTVYLDEPDWIERLEDKEILENEFGYTEDEVEVPDKELERFCFYYVWEYFSIDCDGVYSYFNTLENAKRYFDNSFATDKTYGTAHFLSNGMLDPYKVIGTTL